MFPKTYTNWIFFARARTIYMIALNSFLKMRVKRGIRFASRNDCRIYDFSKGDDFKTVLRLRYYRNKQYGEFSYSRSSKLVDNIWDLTLWAFRTTF